MRRTFFCLIPLLLVSLPCRAEQEADPSFYSFHPMSTMTLGAGISPSDVGRSKIRCIEGEEAPLEKGALSTQFTTKLVTNSEQLQTALGLDTKIDASYLVYKGGASFSFKYNMSSSDDSATLVVTAKSEYGRKGFKRRPHLTKEASDLLTNAALFERTCGSRYVNLERRGASVSAIITILRMSREEKTALSIGASGQGGWGNLSASGEATFTAELARAVKTGRADVQVVATGGTGFGGLGETIKALGAHPDSLPAIQAALGLYLVQFDAENSVPIGFHVESMESFGWRPASEDLWTLQKERKLVQLVSAYRATSQAIETANAMKAGTDIRLPIMDKSEVGKISEAVSAWEAKLDEIANAHRKCKANEDLSSCQEVLPPANLSLIPALPAGPRASFRVVVDDEVLGEIESRTIVYDNSSGLLERVRNVRQDAKSAKIVFVIGGEHLLGANLQFRGEPLTRSLRVLPIGADGGSFDIANAAGLAGIMKDIFNFTTITSPTGKGVFFLKLRDKLGRVFDVNVYEAEWNSNPPFSNMKANYTAY